MDYISIRTSMHRLPIAYPRQITEDFRLRTQAVSYLFRGFAITPSFDVNGLKLVYTGLKDNVVHLFFNSGIIIDTQHCSLKLYIGFTGETIMRYLDPNNNPLPTSEPWLGHVQIGDAEHGFNNYPFYKNQVEIFTQAGQHKQFPESETTVLPPVRPSKPSKSRAKVTPHHPEQTLRAALSMVQPPPLKLNSPEGNLVIDEAAGMEPPPYEGIPSPRSAFKPVKMESN